MAKNVFILGAGASVDAGVPLMQDFYGSGIGLLEDDNRLDAEEKIAFTTVHEAYKNHIRHLYENLEFDPDLRNIETLFSLIDMARITCRFSSLNASDIQGLRDSLVRFIVTTIEKRINLTRLPTGPIEIGGNYTRFRNLVHKIQKQKPQRKCAIISFNYDLALDFALASPPNELQIDYCLSPEDIEADYRSVKVMKLHGSLNWTRCANEKCNSRPKIKVFDYNECWKWIPTGGAPEILKIACNMEKKCDECGELYNNLPVIVPPTWNKAEEAGISNVWHHAAKELTDAKNVFIIGYSLPVSDQFFKYLFALGTMDISQLERLWVYNPTSSINDKFKKMFKHDFGVKYDFREMKFQDATYELNKLF